MTDILPVLIAVLPFAGIIAVVYAVNKRAGKVVALILGSIFCVALLFALFG